MLSFCLKSDFYSKGGAAFVLIYKLTWKILFMKHDPKPLPGCSVVSLTQKKFYATKCE